MSIPVDLADLAATMAERGSGYLLTVSSAGRVKVVGADPRVVGDVLVVDDPGGGSVTNIERNPAVTLLFPPAEPGGHTLLVDGIAALAVIGERTDEGADDGAEEGTGDDAGDHPVPRVEVRVEPHHAVLHRPAPPAERAAAVVDGGCGHDCRPVGEPS